MNLIGLCHECKRIRWLARVFTHSADGPTGICRPCDRASEAGTQATSGQIHERAGQCTGKMKHPSKEAAKRHLKRARSFSGRGNIRVYRCPWCGYWHLGGKAKKQAEPAETRYTEGNEPLGGGER